jgi:putative transposase
MTMRYRTTWADDADLRQRMRAIAEVRRRFGYRRLRLHVLLRRRDRHHIQPMISPPR